MAAIFTSRPVVDGHLIGNRFFNVFAGIAGALAAWNDARVTRNALARLSDHELDDLGLSRGDVDRFCGPSSRA